VQEDSPEDIVEGVLFGNVCRILANHQREFSLEIELIVLSGFRDGNVTGPG